MNLTPVAVASAVALLAVRIPGNQTAPPAGLIRDVAVSTCALVVKADGSVVFWGRDADGQAARPPSPTRVVTALVVLDLPGKALQVALGETTEYALLEDGTFVAWGTNDEGQLGNGAMGIYPKPSINPVRVTGLANIIQIEAGRKHAVALRQGCHWEKPSRTNAAGLALSAQLRGDPAMNFTDSVNPSSDRA